jgi:hypothetical protein
VCSLLAGSGSPFPSFMNRDLMRDLSRYRSLASKVSKPLYMANTFGQLRSDLPVNTLSLDNSQPRHFPCAKILNSARVDCSLGRGTFAQ